MAYDRWGMTNAGAENLTQVGAGDGATLTDAIMAAAEDDLVDMLGWRPDPTDYDEADGTFTDERALAYGRAVAWQSAYRSQRSPSPNDAAARVTSESMPDYSASYEGGKREGGPVASRAVTLLERFGWTASRRATRTSLGRGRLSASDWQTA